MGFNNVEPSKLFCLHINFLSQPLVSLFLPSVSPSTPLSIPLLCSPLSLRFVRKEKEIAETRYEIAQAESLRQRLRVQQLEHELKDLQESLNTEREKMQVRRPHTADSRLSRMK